MNTGSAPNGKWGFRDSVKAFADPSLERALRPVIGVERFSTAR